MDIKVVVVVSLPKRIQVSRQSGELSCVVDQYQLVLCSVAVWRLAPPFPVNPVRYVVFF